MKHCAILSMDDPTGFEIYDHLLEPPLAAAGWQSTTLSWRAPVDWSDFDVVIIRSPWDYQDDVARFMTVLQTIEDSRATLQNPLHIVRWNIHKRYLAELEEKGVAIVPTGWHTSMEGVDLEAWFDRFETSELIVKPCISANADDTYRVPRTELDVHAATIATRLAQRDSMVQPFMPAIITEGEYSLFYFNGRYSHAILKTPRTHDFRVQEEHGGRLQLVTPEPALLQAGQRTLDAIDETLLYARVDFVRDADRFLLMEAELIEPSLYFNLDPDAPQRFVDALETRFRR